MSPLTNPTNIAHYSSLAQVVFLCTKQQLVCLCEHICSEGEGQLTHFVLNASLESIKLTHQTFL